MKTEPCYDCDGTGAIPAEETYTTYGDDPKFPNAVFVFEDYKDELEPREIIGQYPIAFGGFTLTACPSCEGIGIDNER